MHYWSFASGSNTPDSTIGGGSINCTVCDVATDTLNTNLNSRLGKINNSYLKIRNPVSSVTLSLPTQGFQNVVFTFMITRSNSGPQQNYFKYTLDGAKYTDSAIGLQSLMVTPDWTIYQIDFTNIPGANNNPYFGLQITYNVNNTGTSGNDRYDNLVMEGDTIPRHNNPPVVVHYWDFNGLTDYKVTMPPMPLPTPDMAVIPGARLEYLPVAPNTIALWDTLGLGTIVNSLPGAGSGLGLRLRNPAGSFILSLPTTGYDSVRLSYAVERSNSGAQLNMVSYSTDGTNFINSGLSTSSVSLVADTVFAAVSHNFSHIPGTGNNPNFKVKIDFANGNTGTKGNNRFDNIRLEGVKRQ